MIGKMYVTLKENEPIAYTESEHAAWDHAAINAQVSNWWLIQWDSEMRADIRSRGYDVKSCTITID